MKWKDYLAIVTSTLLVLLIGLLVVQHLRHGWPFSLHHGLAAATALPVAYAAHDAPKPATSTQPRVQVELDPAKADGFGIRLAPVQEETIAQSFRAVATIVPDESRLSHVHTRVAGWIEQFFVNTTGESVREGQPLAAIFSQELLASQAEYLAARRAGSNVVLQGARSRLQVFGMTEVEIGAIEERGEPRRLVTVTAPRSGIVLHRGISVGTAVDPSTELMTVADLSQVWVIAEVAEGDIPHVRVGGAAILDFPASGRPPFDARVEFLYPTLSERTRTLRARFVVANPDQSLRPGIYGTAVFEVAPRTALSVPRDAVVDTGAVQHVFVAESEGRFVPRPVKLGVRQGDRIEIREGLAAGERVVASGVFLIDSESRLRASGTGTGHAHGSTEPKKPDSRQAGPGHEGHRTK